MSFNELLLSERAQAARLLLMDRIRAIVEERSTHQHSILPEARLVQDSAAVCLKRLESGGLPLDPVHSGVDLVHFRYRVTANDDKLLEPSVMPVLEYNPGEVLAAGADSQQLQTRLASELVVADLEPDGGHQFGWRDVYQAAYETVSRWQRSDPRYQPAEDQLLDLVKPTIGTPHLLTNVGFVNWQRATGQLLTNHFHSASLLSWCLKIGDSAIYFLYARERFIQPAYNLLLAETGAGDFAKGADHISDVSAVHLMRVATSVDYPRHIANLLK